MIDKAKLETVIKEYLARTNLFPVSVKVTPTNEITVTVDSADGVDVEQCVALTRHIEEAFDRDVEDYELEVGSAGLTAPFTVPEQYRMNIGNPVELLTRDGRKMRGTLKAVDDDCTQITVAVPTKVKNPGDKRPHIEEIEHKLPVADIKKIVREIVF